MTAPSPEQVAAIVAGLTKTQRAAVVRCWNDGNEIIVGGQDHTGIDTRVVNSLRCKDLLSWKATGSLHEVCWVLNELGLAVQAALQSKDQ